MVIKLLMYFSTMIQLLINCILMGLIIYFVFQIQIHYMSSLENVKVSGSLHAITFYTIGNPNFP
jgi:hypothetical protein